MLNLWLEILKNLSFGQKIQLLLLLFFSFLVAVAEVLSLGATIPFFYSLMDTPNLEKGSLFIIPEISNFLQTKDYSRTTYVYIFFGALTLASFLRMSYQIFLNNFTFKISAQFAAKKFNDFTGIPKVKNKLSVSPFMLFTARMEKIPHALLLPTFNLISSFVIFIVFLIIFIPAFQLEVGQLIGIAGIIAFFLRKNLNSYLKKESVRNQELYQSYFQYIEGFFRMRDVIYTSRKLADFKDKIGANISQAYKSDSKIVNLSLMPRFFIELLIFVVLVFTFATGIFRFDVESIIFFGLTIVGLQRLSPYVVQTMAASAQLNGVHRLISDFLKIESSFYLENTTAKDVPFKGIMLRDFTLKHNKRHILKIDKLNIPNKGVVQISGPSGVGKTTFLRALVGLHQDYSGSIYFNGTKHENADRSSLYDFFKVGFLTQENFMFPATLLENCTFSFAGENLHLREKTQHFVDRLGLSNENLDLNDVLSDDSGNYSGLVPSGGQKQRIGLVRTLMLDPDIYILDEPTSALDKKSIELVSKQIMEISKSSLVMLVSHNHLPSVIADVEINLANYAR